MNTINLTLVISAILFTTKPVVAMEGVDTPEIPSSSMGQQILPHEKVISIDPLDLSTISIEKTTEPLPKRKVSKTLPLNRRKSSGSPRVGAINSPKSVLPNQTIPLVEDQRKDLGETKEFSSSVLDEQCGSPKCLITTPQEKKIKSPRPGFKRYSLEGPIDILGSSSNSSQVEQKDFPKYHSNEPQEEKNEFPRDQSPIRQSRSQVF